MKNRKHYTKILLFAAGLFLFTACFELESEVYDKINPDIYPKNAEEADGLVLSSVYHAFCPWYIFNVAQGYMSMSELQTDEFELSIGNKNGRYLGFENTGWGGYPVTRDDITPAYSFANHISRMILTMDRIKDVPMTDEQRTLLNAQIKCGIGCYVFLEYDLYGPISLVPLDVLKKPLDDIVVPRATEEEMQAYIETHLLDAAADLPYKWENDADYGRFTKGLANMLLLKYYMYMGGRKKNEGNTAEAKTYWEKAVAVGRELWENRAAYGYELVSDYYSMFTLAGEKNSERIYSVSCRSEGGFGHAYLAHVLQSDYPAGQAIRYGSYHMAWDHYDTFYPKGEIPKKDKRADPAKLVTAYVGETGTNHSRADQDGGLFYGPIPMKFDFNGTIGDQCPVDLPVYRFSDAVTLYAEAIVRNGGSVQDGLTLLNEVRLRHGGSEIPLYTTVDAPGPAKFFDLVLQERGFDLFLEGVRRADLIRHDKYISTGILIGEKAGLSPERINKMRNKSDGIHYDYERYPLPVSIVTSSFGVIQQNPGY
jgi:hypothetical protein